jgi:hypothetical protein
VYSTLLFLSAVQTCCSEAEDGLEVFDEEFYALRFAIHVVFWSLPLFCFVRVALVSDRHYLCNNYTLFVTFMTMIGTRGTTLHGLRRPKEVSAVTRPTVQKIPNDYGVLPKT